MIDTTELVRELVYQIRLGEDSAYEFKAVELKGRKIQSPHKDTVADEITALANTGGGILVLGVHDKTHPNNKREVQGIPVDNLDDVELWLTNIINDNISPAPLVQIRFLEVPDQAGHLKPVIWVRVSKSVFVHKGPGGYYHRVGSSKREMAPDLLARMFQQRSMARLIRFDEQVMSNAPIEAANPDLAQRFLRDNSLPENAQLKKLYLIGEDEEKQICLTVSGVLLLTNQPTDYLPSAWVQCVCYSGTERNSEYQIDALDCRESIDQQIVSAFAFVRRRQ